MSLPNYEQARRFDVAASGLGMDAMNRLFSNDVSRRCAACAISACGWSTATPALKRYFIEEAGGALGAAPRLLRGLAI